MKPAWYTGILLMGPLLIIASGSANSTQPLWNPPPSEGLLVFHHRSSGETFRVGLGRASARVGWPGGASITMQTRVPSAAGPSLLVMAFLLVLPAAGRGDPGEVGGGPVQARGWTGFYGARQPCGYICCAGGLHWCPGRAGRCPKRSKRPPSVASAG